VVIANNISPLFAKALKVLKKISEKLKSFPQAVIVVVLMELLPD
jgi:hypothetical protein